MLARGEELFPFPDVSAAYRPLFPRPPEQSGGQETRDGGIFLPAELFVRVPPGINIPTAEEPPRATAHKDAQCLRPPVLCQHAFPLGKKRRKKTCVPWPETVNKNDSLTPLNAF